jgi:hypothetical protein
MNEPTLFIIPITTLPVFHSPYSIASAIYTAGNHIPAPAIPIKPVITIIIVTLSIPKIQRAAPQATETISENIYKLRIDIFFARKEKIGKQINVDIA